MPVTLLHALILKCLHTINGERTISSVYHLLSGKKSSQTIQDAHLYRLSYLFKTLPRWSRKQFEKNINDLFQKDLIVSLNEDSKWIVTDQGINAYTDFFKENAFPKYIQGLKYQDVSILMWKRLTLLVQAISYLSHGENRYIPIVKDPDVRDWVKNILIQYPKSRSNLASCLFDELYSILNSPFPENPNIVVMRLSGFQSIGLTATQIAEFLEMELSESHFRFMNAQHYMIQVLIKDHNKYNILSSLLKDIYQKVPYTKTALRTYELLKQNLTIEEIAKLRNLKASTVEDHIIEIALNNQQFPITPYVDQESIEKISTIANTLGVRKLKPIKEKLSDVSYFQIRLVLSRLGVKKL